MVIICNFPQDYGPKHLGKPADRCDFYFICLRFQSVNTIPHETTAQVAEIMAGVRGTRMCKEFALKNGWDSGNQHPALENHQGRKAISGVTKYYIYSAYILKK